MPSLEELRRWLKGDEVEGLPLNRPEPPPVQQPEAPPSDLVVCGNCSGSGEDPERPDGICPACDGVGQVTRHTRPLNDKMAEKAAESKRGGKYTVLETSGRRDAVLRFGKHSGQKISDLARRAPDYLQWILKEGFNPELKDIIREYVTEPRMSVKEFLRAKTKAELLEMAPRYGAVLDESMKKRDMIVKLMIAIKKRGRRI